LQGPKASYAVPLAAHPASLWNKTWKRCVPEAASGSDHANAFKINSFAHF
jgi:hypothetical protein